MIFKTYDFTTLINDLIGSAEAYSFNLKDLPDTDDFKLDLRKHEKFQNIFDELNKKTSSCLYWFEIDSNENCSSLIQLLDKKRKSLKKQLRTVPAKNKNTDSKVLYVGIRRGGIRKRDGLTNISGRILIHLGYYDKGRTQGLQLVHWAVESGFTVQLNVVQFEDGFPNEYLGALEKIMAHKLKPLCGKH